MAFTPPDSALKAGFMREEKLSLQTIFLPLLVIIGALLLWGALSHFQVLDNKVFPSPMAVMKGFQEESRLGLTNNIIASLFRVTMGFGLAVALGIPLGLW